MNISLLLKLLKSRIVQSGLVLVLGLGIGYGIHKHFTPPQARVVQSTPDTKTIYVEKPVLSEKEVVKLVNDPTQSAKIKELMAENSHLKLEVIQLSSTVAENKVTGGTNQGGVVTTPTPSVEAKDTLHEFKDWQLDAQYDSSTFNYALNQKFTILSSTGRGKDGQKVSLVKLLQTGKDGKLVQIPATTTVIFADEAMAKWFIGPRIQAGLGYTKDKETGGIVAFQWFKHGKSGDPKDIRWAIGSPAIFVNKGVRDIGLLPFSFNSGTIKYSPFSNLWFGPFVSKTRVGIAVTATF